MQDGFREGKQDVREPAERKQEEEEAVETVRAERASWFTNQKQTFVASCCDLVIELLEIQGSCGTGRRARLPTRVRSP